MSDVVQVYKSRDGLWRWRRLARNGEQVARSEQGYRSKWYCKFRAKTLNGNVEVVVLPVGSYPA